MFTLSKKRVRISLFLQKKKFNESILLDKMQDYRIYMSCLWIG